MTKRVPRGLEIPSLNRGSAETSISTLTGEVAAEQLSTPGPKGKDSLAQEPSTIGAAGSLRIRDRIKEFRRVRARGLIRNPKNWRRHPKSQIAALSGLLRGIGYAAALLVRQLPNGRYMIIDGHLRAEITPDAMVPVLVLDVTEEEADKLLLTLDPSAAMAEADADRISELLKTVRTENQAVEDLLRRTAGEDLWRKLHPDEIQEAEIPTDRAEELKEKWRTETGQLWQIGPHRVICADCTRDAEVGLLWRGERRLVQEIWTDSPYGVFYAEKNRLLNRSDRGNRIQKPITNDHLSEAETGALFRDGLIVASKHCEPGACVYACVPGGRSLACFIVALEAAGFAFKSTLVWVKNHFVIGMSDYHFRHELILYGWLQNGAHLWNGDRSQDSVFEVDRPHASDLHPTTKPVELIARMVANSSRRGDVVYDPFCGSGSTLVAAHQLERIGYGCEIDPGYVAVALERLSLLGLKPELVDK